jgi:hypothetical protein
MRTGARRYLCPIDNRYTFIQQLREKDDPRLDIFKDAASVEKLVDKQVQARNMARCAMPGWEDALKKAEIWDEVNEQPRHVLR